MKPWLAPDIAESIRSGVPKPWLAPDLAQAIRSGVSTPWLPQDVASDVADAAGGGSVPEWVPANAKIYIDLVNDRAWTEADGEVAINTLLGADANADSGWGSTSVYNPANLTADGYISGFVALIGSARTKVLEGATARVLYEQPTSSANGARFVFVLLSANGNDALEIDLLSNRNATAYSWGGSFSTTLESVVNAGQGSKNSFAATITSARCDIAVNGGSAAAGTLLDADRPVANPLVAAAFDISTNPDYQAIQSITIYDALPSTAGLSALSETGVTNTAPTVVGSPPVPLIVFDHIYTGQHNLFEGNVEVEAVVAGIFGDAQGNPLVYSIGSFDPALPVARLSPDGVTSPTGANNIDKFFGDFGSGVAAGTYNFTLRATDPGGLYVEQQFTITVTA